MHEPKSFNLQLVLPCGCFHHDVAQSGSENSTRQQMCALLSVQRSVTQKHSTTTQHSSAMQESAMRTLWPSHKMACGEACSIAQMRKFAFHMLRAPTFVWPIPMPSRESNHCCRRVTCSDCWHASASVIVVLLTMLKSELPQTEAVRFRNGNDAQ